jgi:ribosomal protein S18 acetylase RimI-like enzyme
VPWKIREVDRKADRRSISAIDTSFETQRIYEVAVATHSIGLVERTVEPAIRKSYPMADAFAPWSTWDTGWVALDDDNGVALGFAAVEYEAWHARLVLWHLYVARSHRRSGIGRALLGLVEEYGRSRGAKRVWLETTSVNVPGIAAYGRLGYMLVGVDTTVYDTLPYEDEAAVYLAKLL